MPGVWKKERCPVTKRRLYPESAPHPDQGLADCDLIIEAVPKPEFKVPSC
jgi:hypothetical protein